MEPSTTIEINMGSIAEPTGWKDICAVSLGPIEQRGEQAVDTKTTGDTSEISSKNSKWLAAIFIESSKLACQCTSTFRDQWGVDHKRTRNHEHQRCDSRPRPNRKTGLDFRGRGSCLLQACCYIQSADELHNGPRCGGSTPAGQNVGRLPDKDGSSSRPTPWPANQYKGEVSASRFLIDAEINIGLDQRQRIEVLDGACGLGR